MNTNEMLEQKAIQEIPLNIGDEVKYHNTGKIGIIAEMYPIICQKNNGEKYINRWSDGTPCIDIVVIVDGKRSCADWSNYIKQ